MIHSYYDVDGNLIKQEIVPDIPEPPTPPPTPSEDRDAMLADLSFRTTMLEMGVI